MPRKELRTSLEELKKEVDEALADKSENSLLEVRTKLDSILTDIDETADDSLKEGISGVSDSLLELEVSHPNITSSFNQVMNLLSSLGI